MGPDWEAALRLDAVFAPAPGEAVYAAADRGPGAMRAAWEPKGESGWLARWSESPDPKGPTRPLRDEEFRQVENGLVLVRTIDHQEQVEAVFQPPMLVLAREMRVGEKREQRLEMTVHPLADRSQLRAAGHIVNETVYVGDDELLTPAGTILARHVRSVFTADPAGTSVRNETDVWYADGLGIVAERRKERTTFLGVPMRARDESWVLAGPPATK